MKKINRIVNLKKNYQHFIMLQNKNDMKTKNFLDKV